MMINLTEICSTTTQTNLSESTGLNNSISSMPFKPQMKIAVCLTGQLLRLEILSKLRYLMAHNTVQLGHRLDMFILLDNDVKEVKQTYWRHDYSNAIYRNMTSSSLETFINTNLKRYENKLRAVSPELRSQGEGPFATVVRISLAPPVQANYTILRGKVPVGDKSGPVGEDLPTVKDVEPAAIRFQNNMRWMGGLRSCVKWVQQVEQQQQWFYDIIIRLRDDSYLLGPWRITAEKYRGAFVTAAVAPNFGVNDHNFAVDRRWADSVFRGVTEDYYFNETLDMYSWTNTEHRIFKILTSKNIPIRTTNVCEQPVTHLRGMASSTYWRLHPTYSNILIAACGQGMEQENPIVELQGQADALRSGGPLPLRGNFISAFLSSYWGKEKGKVAAKESNSVTSKPTQRSQKSKKNEKGASEAHQDKPRKLAADESSCCLPEWLEILNSGKVKVHL